MEDRRPKNSLLPQSMLDAGDAEWSTLRDLISQAGELASGEVLEVASLREHTALFSSVGVEAAWTSVRCPAMATKLVLDHKAMTPSWNRESPYSALSARPCLCPKKR